MSLFSEMVEGFFLVMPIRSASECTYNFSSRFKIITSGFGYSFFQTTPLSNIQSELLKLFSVEILKFFLVEESGDLYESSKTINSLTRLYNIIILRSYKLQTSNQEILNFLYRQTEF